MKVDFSSVPMSIPGRSRSLDLETDVLGLGNPPAFELHGAGYVTHVQACTEVDLLFFVAMEPVDRAHARPQVGAFQVIKVSDRCAGWVAFT